MLACPRCSAALPETFFNASDLHPCPFCAAQVQVEVFPALLTGPAIGSAGETVVLEGESSCFYHPSKRATAACDSCGRFLCALCDLDLNGQHLCPGCLKSGKRKGKLKNLENRRMRYDSMALMLAFVPLLIFYLTVFTAPATLYIVIRYWNAPGSLISRGRWRMVIAFIAALLQILAWIAGIYMLINYRVTRR
jgi:hypothetical protein